MINENFSIVEMDESMNSNRIFQILLDQIPKHVIYDQTTQKLFVCFERMGKGSMIKVIDPHTKKSVKDVFLKDKETVTCVTIWNLKSTKRYICVGTKGYRDSNGIWGGRVLVYSLKLKSDKINYSLNQPGGYEFPHSVTAIKSYGPYLLVASGRTLNQLKIDESARTIVLGATIKLRSHTHSISTVEKYIFLGCIEDSICIYKAAFHEKKFIPITCDDIPHEIVDCIAFKQTLHSHIIFSLNTYQCINGYRFDDQKSILIQHLTFNLQEICLKFSMANLSTDIISSIENPIELNDFDFHLDWDIKLPKKFIYCISNQGTLYKLTKLSSFIYTILIFIQDLLELHPNTKPLLGGTLKSFRSTPYQQYQNMIDGLFIKQFCKLNESDRKSIMIHFNDWWVHVFQIKYRNSVLVGGEALLIKKDVVLATDVDVIIQRLES
ncbi:CPSF A subunit region-domain-containing protein [Globomyces pollinis-pini]|nr:CPSF A subunit region-domain-containing protein [Globomyces pollinis-pini]